MNKHTKQLQVEFNSSVKLPCFEIPVRVTHSYSPFLVTDIKAEDGKKDWLLCDVMFYGKCLIAEHHVLNSQNGTNSHHVVVDDCLTLDENLQKLHEEVCNSITQGDLFALAE
jgi:hypothetical protein